MNKVFNRNYKLLTLAVIFAISVSFLHSPKLQQIAKNAFALTSVSLRDAGDLDSTVGDNDDIEGVLTGLSGETAIYRWTVNGGTINNLIMPFNSGAIQSDYSGNTNNGNKVGMSFNSTASGNCQVGSCYDFNGISDVMNYTMGNFDLSNATQGAVKAWVKTSANCTGTNGRCGIVDYDYDATGSHRLQLALNTSNQVVFELFDGVTTHTLTSATTVNDGSWHQLVGSWSPSGMELYIDTTQAASNATAVNLGAFTPNSARSGAIFATSALDDYYTGTLDEIAIYKRAMNANMVSTMFTDAGGGLTSGPTQIDSALTTISENWSLIIQTHGTASDLDVTSLSSSNQIIIGGGVNLNTPADDENLEATVITSPAPGQYGYRWTKNGINQQTLNFPGQSGLTQEDLSGKNLDGTLENGAVYTTSGKVAGGLEFDGINDFLEIPANATLETALQGAHTLSFWIYSTKDTNQAGWQRVFDNPFTTHTNPFYNFFGQINPNEHFVVFHSDFGNVNSLEVLPKNQWVHVSVVVDPKSGLYMYLDGVLQQANLGAPGTPLTTYSTDFNFGTLVNCCKTSQYAFGGRLDEILLQDRALTKTEIDHLVAQGNATLGAPSIVDSVAHRDGESWQLFYSQISATGTLAGENSVGPVVITSAAEATTIGVTTPVGIQAGAISISYTCTNSANEPRDLFVEYSTNGGGGFSPAMVSNSSSGFANVSHITDATCDGSTQTFDWGSIAQIVAKGSTNAAVQIRITPIAAGTGATTASFTVTNPINLCDLAGEAADGVLTAAETSFDGGAISIFDCVFSIDGAHTFTDVYIGGGGADIGFSYLNHSDTTTSTEFRIDMTTTGDFNLDGGIVLLLGRGYEAGNTGYTNGNTTAGGSTVQTGGSHGGLGGDTGPGVPANTYGSITAPVTLGGGGASHGSLTVADGGGAIQVTANNAILNGLVIADGANGPFSGNANGGGAGGSIYFLVTNTTSGNGSLSADGGDAWGASFEAGGGGGGRISIDTGTNSFTGTLSASGGTRNENIGAGGYGGAGTIYTKTSAQINGTLLVDNSNLVPAEGSTPITIPTTFDAITIQNDGRVDINGVTSIVNDLAINGGRLQQSNTVTPLLSIGGDLNLTNSGVITHAITTTSQEYRLELDITGTVTIDGTSSIDVISRGYRQGASAGYTEGNTTVGGSTFQNGGSHGGIGGTSGGVSATPYGSVTTPITLGSGASHNTATNASGNGGGAVKITAPTLVLNGTITVDGGDGSGAPTNGEGGGGGGSVWIDVDTLSGNGVINANGGDADGDAFAAGGGGGGRVAIHIGTDSFTGQVTAYGGLGNLGGGIGGAGTYYHKLDAATNGDLFIDNNSQVPQVESTPIPSTPTIFDNVTISNAGRVLITDLATIANDLSLSDANSQLTFGNTATPVLSVGGNVSLSNGAIFTTSETTTSQEYRVDLQVTGDVTIDATSSFNVSSKGYTPGRTNGNTTTGGATGQTGGSHGGVGGDVFAGTGVAAYGSLIAPISVGAGGAANGGTAGDGGGALKISASTLTNNGAIRADGGDFVVAGNGSGGGGGGSIWLDVTTLTGSGAITANGGDAGTGTFPDGGGGGGRIAIYYDTNSSTGAITAYGGDVQHANNYVGSGGTVFLKDNAISNGNLTVNNNSLNSHTNIKTPLYITGEPATYTFVDLFVINEAELLIDTPCSGTPALTITGSIDLSNNGLITNNQPGTCTVSTAALIITSALPDGNVNTAYSEQVQSPGGYAPKTFECLDGLGGSVVACNAASGWPNGITMNASGLVTGTPTNGGSFSPIIRVTDSDPGGAQVAEQTMSLFINSAPNNPVLVSPADASSVGTATPTLSAQYTDIDIADTGTTDYRISSGSAGDCLTNTNTVDSGTSAATGTNNEATTYTVGVALSHSSTYNWCARNNDGSAFSNGGAYTTMGSFTVDLGGAPNEPILVAPANASTTNQLSPLLEVNYSDPDIGDTGTAEFRVSSGSAANCLSNINIVWSGASLATTTNNETASATVGVALTNLATYNWCARNNDGIFTSNSGNYTTMGSFLIDSSFTDGGSLGTILQNQQGGGGSEPIDPITEIDSYEILLSFENVNKQPISNEVDPNEVLFGRIVMTNTNDIIAEDVFMDLPIPETMQYIPGSLKINTIKQTDDADSDKGQANQNAVSAIWAQINPQETKIITFQLLFKQNDGGLTQASAIAALQAFVSASNSTEAFASNVVDFDSGEDITPSPPEPTPTPEPDPTPDPESPAEPEPTPEPLPDPTPDPEPDSDPEPTPSPTPEAPSEIGSTPTSPVIPLESPELQPSESPSGSGSEEDDLFLTGSLQSQNEQLEFTGTVNEPDSEVIVTINGTTFSVTSDENGIWQAFVSAEELGIEPGQSTQVRVEAIAQKEGKQSNKLAQDIFVERSGEELVALPIEPTVSSNILTKQLTEIISEQEEEIQTTLAVVAPVVVISSVPIWGYLPYLPTMFFHLISWLLGVFGRKKKEDRFYGVVYDSISKQPIPLAIVRIYKLIDSEPGVHENHSRKLVKTVVTDKEGRYEALLEVGEYEMDVKKPQFTFPSSIVTSGPDGEYTTIYTGMLAGTESIATPDIPIDPENAPKKWQTASVFKKLWMSLQKVTQHLAVPILFIGAGAAILVLVNDANNPINWILSILYILMLIMQITFRMHPLKAWGMVYDVATNAALPLTTLQLIDPEFGKIVKTRLSDYEGRFSFLPEPGNYIIKANKEGYTQAEVVEARKGRQPITKQIQIEQEGQKITGDIAMKS